MVVVAERRPVFEVDVAELETMGAALAAAALSSDGKIVSPSGVLHGLRPAVLYGSREPARPELELRAFFDEASSESSFGKRILVRTRTGAAYRTPTELYPDAAARESHKSQVLATLGEFRVPLSQTIRIAGVDSTLEDVLRDTVARFDLHRVENEWDVLALLFYLPPERRWHNRFGVACDFDEVAGKLRTTVLATHSCNGTHVFQVMLTMLAVDEVCPVLDAAERKLLQARVAELVERIVRNQNADGSWGALWHAGSAQGAPGTLVVTGHLLEFLGFVPKCIRVPDETLRKGARWLWDCVRAKSPDEYAAHICPLTHSLCALRRLARQ